MVGKFPEIKMQVFRLNYFEFWYEKFKMASWVLFLEILTHQMLIVDTINIYNLQNLLTNLEPVPGTESSLASWLVRCSNSYPGMWAQGKPFSVTGSYVITLKCWQEGFSERASLNIQGKWVAEILRCWERIGSKTRWVLNPEVGTPICGGRKAGSLITFLE